jgi:hypothetical protein
VCARLVGALMAERETVEVSTGTIEAAAKQLDPSSIARETGFSGADLELVVSRVSLALQDVVKIPVKVDVGSRKVSLVPSASKKAASVRTKRDTAGSSDGH